VVAIPPPPVTYRQRGSSLRLSDLAPLRCSYPKGATRFYPGAQESLAAFSSKPFGFNTGRHLEQQPPVAPLSRALPHRSPIPVLVIETRKLRDTQGYTSGHFFRQTFLCFIFQQAAIFSDPGVFRKNTRRIGLFTRHVITFARAYAKLGMGWNRDFDVQKFSLG